jgi:hypothetical protein
LGRLKFFRKFAEIFAAQDAPPRAAQGAPVSLTPVANGKNLQEEKVLLFFFTPLGSRISI